MASPLFELLLLGVIVYIAFTLKQGFNQMAVNFERANAALQAQADAIEEVAEAIRDPQTDTASQAAADELAGKLEASVEALRGLAAEERELDNPTPAVEPPVEG